MKEARARLQQAVAYLRLAGSAAEEPEGGGRLDSARAGTAVLAAIAASDAICCALLHQRARGQDHREAIALLEIARWGPGDKDIKTDRARRASRALAEALGIKDQAHYGIEVIGAGQVKRAMRAAQLLVDAAEEVLANP
ncbi:MAG: hypothetical protein H0T66_10105 [Geodermatophilaceae bacterium]|nr:hypothetical protein [Geodermatophilaceae bacterium]MDQ3454636.1 hypothetical protein [Actinomycetota bacterium]